MSHSLQCRFRHGLMIAACLWLAACTTAPEQQAATEEPPPKVRTTPHEEAPLRAMLAFYSTNARAPAPAPRERPQISDPYLQMQQAIQLGQARLPELPRALNLLEAVMKSSHPAAVNLVPLARLLHEQYSERLRLDVQLREAHRRSEQLQEKIEALSAIERNLPARPPTKQPAYSSQENAR
jgi:hypothetical protein